CHPADTTPFHTSHIGFVRKQTEQTSMEDELMFSMEEEGSAVNESEAVSASKPPLLRSLSEDARAKVMPDPWAEFHLEEKETEVCTRYRYNAVKGEWAQDQVHVKMAAQAAWKHAIEKAKVMPDPWAEFHLEEKETEVCTRYSKKLSNFSNSSNWKSAANYVAKSYMHPVERQVYFEDVTSRPDKPLFHLEHYIEGKYIKYNSNSGFVRDDNIRLTPQAFSHFTFERSGHKLIVVDIQGWATSTTDPQIHTREGRRLRDGNLGVRGMALYFHSHLCNKICKSMGLTPFDHSSAERSQLDGTSKLLKSAQTVLRGGEEQCGSPRIRTFSGCPAPPLFSRLSETSSSRRQHERRRRRRWQRLDAGSDSGGDSGYPSEAANYVAKSYMHPVERQVYFEDKLSNFSNSSNWKSAANYVQTSERRSEGDQQDHVDGAQQRPQRHYSESDEDSVRRLTEEKWTFYHSSRDNVHRPSCVAVEMERLSSALLVKKIGQSVLGKVHLAMVRYHEAGRFCEKDEAWDKDSALYHLERASMCGELEAIVALGQCYMQLPHHILSDMELEGNAGNRMKGFKYLIQAAKAGDRHSMILVARAFDTGVNLSADRKQDWVQAVFWYTSALNMCDDDEGGDFDGLQDDPRYLVLARQAEMYQEGGFELAADPQKAGDLFTEAAEAAMEAMKGRLANQYYMKAEEAWALMEEEED
ncbi:hypothetical protein CRUP_033298, partial [Coryphaenoides rupestris]